MEIMVVIGEVESDRIDSCTGVLVRLPLIIKF